VSVLAFDFFLVEPRFTFAVHDTQYIITFAVTLVVGLVIGTLTARLREQARAARERERRTDALYRLSRQLAAATGSDFLVAMARKQLRELLDFEAAILLPDEAGRLTYRAGQESQIAANPTNLVVAQWAFEHEQAAGLATATLPNATAMFLPLVGSQRTIGVLGVQHADPEHLRGPDARQLLETCASLTALAIERDQLALAAHEVQLQAEAERLRSALLSSVSHDLRTPLAVISGASSSLLSQVARAQEGSRRELLETIQEEADRLARLVDNLLEMTRIEAQGVQPQRQWHVVEELVGSALARLETRLAGRQLAVQIPADLPLVQVDGLLIEQVIINLVDNALKYTPPSTAVRVSAAIDGAQLLVQVHDAGPGLAPGEETKIFEKFYRGNAAGTARGSGLGLAICRAIVLAHGGGIGAANLPGGGARFWFRLPLETPPAVEQDLNAV
jgi:two-component system sensor histidine kinase KdpD